MVSHPEPPNHRRHAHLRSTLSRARERRRGDGPAPELTLGERLSDLVAEIVGSWRFILIQSGLLLAWLAANITLGGPISNFVRGVIWMEWKDPSIWP